MLEFLNFFSIFFVLGFGGKFLKKDFGRTIFDTPEKETWNGSMHVILLPEPVCKSRNTNKKSRKCGEAPRQSFRRNQYPKKEFDEKFRDLSRVCNLWLGPGPLKFYLKKTFFDFNEILNKPSIGNSESLSKVSRWRNFFWLLANFQLEIGKKLQNSPKTQKKCFPP